ncbi:MAG: FAD-binding oxidoreductase, partial [Yoonia sp.]|nr:FAD-binding oxidoreductase [Yoonia sp.]
GGAIYGSSIAWFLSGHADFQGRILVVERDPTYEFASTSHTNSCMRQQFTAAINVQISQFAADFVKNMQGYYGGDDRVPNLPIQSYGYMYLAEDDAFAANLAEAQGIQASLGAGTQHMTAAQIKDAYPFYNMDDIVAGNHNLIDEGYFDGGTMFDWWKKSARERGVEYLSGEVASMKLNAAGSSVDSVTLANGDVISCGTVVNASGPRAKLTAAMAGIDLPVEPRKRYTFIFDAAEPLDRDLPLTIDPSGVHMRSDGHYYLAGCPPDDDGPVGYDDFAADHAIWEQKVWPVLAHRVPAFETIKLTNMWVGHYAYNAFDQNAIVGAHSKVANFVFANGFSGHGLQQSPAIGRGVAELIATGAYQTLDLSPFGYDRIERGEKFVEKAVI